jgi:hypothetical protein
VLGFRDRIEYAYEKAASVVGNGRGRVGEIVRAKTFKKAFELSPGGLDSRMSRCPQADQDDL